MKIDWRSRKSCQNPWPLGGRREGRSERGRLSEVWRRIRQAVARGSERKLVSDMGAPRPALRR